jgi:hypothetical protein
MSSFGERLARRFVSQRRRGTGGSNSGATVNAVGSPNSNPTNAVDDNRVAPTTGNPLIQSGKVK